MFKKIAAILAFGALLAYSAVNYPYPMRKNYGNGTINAVNSTADADLKARFKAFVNNFYLENGNQARIKFDEPENTVSEGIGYGMLMMVYFSDASTSYQSHFDKLWAYYNAHKNGNGVMHWKIRGFDGTVEQNGATDAELDVALALVMAYYQFGDQKYLNDAKSLVDIIWNKEMNSDGLHKPGDAWDNDKNPSYVAPAAFEIFKGLGTSTANNWTSALSRNYTFLKANQNQTSGLPSNWANSDGSMKECSYCGYSSQNYGQDAVRAPWRWATAKAWFGHTDAETLLAKLATWVNTKNPGDIKGPITLPSNNMGTVPNASYLGSLMCALTHKNTYQDKLNTYWSSWATITGDTYFNSAMQILTGLLVSGNMPNLKACASSAGCGTTMPPPGDYQGAYTQLDKLAFAGSENINARNYTVTGEPWFAYTDAKAGYNDNGEPANGQANSSITNVPFTAQDENDNCKNITSYRVVLSSNGSADNGTDWSVQIKNYTLDQGTYKYDPFVALGLDAKNNGKPTSNGGYDLSKCTGGFSYEYKGSSHKFKILNKNIAEGVGSDHYKLIGESKSVANNWTRVVVPPSEVAQPTWVAAANKIPFNLADVRGWAWELPGDTKATNGTVTAGHSPMTGSLALRNFRCLGDMALPPARGKTACGVDIGGGDPSPIVSQLSTHSNAFAVRNGVNLQVSQKAIVEVFSLSGKSISKHEFSNGAHTLMLNNLPKGLYIMKVQFESQREMLRVPVR